MPTLLTDNQLNAVSIIERVCSVFSLLGSMFIIGTFCFSKSFHKPINRLVFYASFGNMLTNVGTLMSRQYVGSPDSVGCQFQAFLIQMFMPADAFWTLAMAINVYLTFYFKFDAARLRSIEVAYLVACYGIPLVPALTYIFLRNGSGQRVYGDATLWCWVVPDWGIWRIATFYGPVWVVIIITVGIYLRCGRTIYEKRKQLFRFATSDTDPISLNGETGGTFKTTEVSITTERIGEPKSLPMQSFGGAKASFTSRANNMIAEYTVSVSADAGGPFNQDPEHVAEPAPTLKRPYRSASVPNVNRRRHYDLNTAAWAYTKCAILFFTALLITWIPSSANRVYSIVHDQKTLPALEFMSALVLPLQGFWNAVIYMVTSWGAMQNLLVDLRLGRRPSVSELVGGLRPSSGQPQPVAHTSPYRPTTRSGKAVDTDSTAELTQARGDESPDGR